MKKCFFILPPLLAAAIPARAEVILLSTDFENAGLGFYTNTMTLANGPATHQQMRVTGVNPANLTKVEVVEQPAGNNALAITAPATVVPASFGGGFIVRDFPLPTLFSKTGKGNHLIEGSFDFERVSGFGEVSFLLNHDRDNFDTSYSTMVFRLANDGRLFSTHYIDAYGGGQQNHITQITLNIPCRMNFSFDMSDGRDFFYTYTITDLRDDSILFSTPPVRGNRFANPAFPDRFSIVLTHRGNDDTPPFVYLDNIHIITRAKIRPTLFLLK